MLDDITELAKQYHLVVWGVLGLVGLLLMVKVYFQNVRGKWKWRKK